MRWATIYAAKRRNEFMFKNLLWLMAGDGCMNDGQW
jgi:hypothetical protein